MIARTPRLFLVTIGIVAMLVTGCDCFKTYPMIASAAPPTDNYAFDGYGVTAGRQASKTDTLWYPGQSVWNGPTKLDSRFSQLLLSNIRSFELDR
jgi:hypothetical protein